MSNGRGETVEIIGEHKEILGLSISCPAVAAVVRRQAGRQAR